ncbi:MAG: TetR/AcrR family transcriptional regulator [Victivallales bacterium]|nr:TetR/AcrR family transcriptional regulator [Victivallales bacterium]
MARDTKTDVKTRLLSTGLRVFANSGYAGATVREISDESETNIAAINYYFGDKKRFYQAVLEYAGNLRREALGKTWEVAQADPWKALRIRVETMLDTTYDDVMFHVNWLFMRELMTENEVRNSQGEDAMARRKSYEERMTNLLTQLLGNDAATLTNIKLLRYTLYSLCLFLPIQTTIENKYLSGKGFFNVKAAVDKSALADFIMKTVKQTVDEMRRQALEALEASREKSNGDGE